MNRLSVKILVFGGLMGLTGIVWAILDASFFSQSIPDLDAIWPSSPVAYALPASLILLISTLWLAGRVVTGSAARGFAVFRILHFVLLPILIPVGIASILSGHGRFMVLATAIGIVLLMIASVTVEYRQARKERKKENPTRPRFPKVWFGTAVLIMLLAAVFLSRWESRDVLRLYYGAGLAGFSLIWAYQLGQLGRIAFFPWFVDSMAIGGLIGALGGLLADRRFEDKGAVQRLLRLAARGFALGAVISGLMFGAHAVMVIRWFQVAWNQHQLLHTSLFVWGVVGCIVGIMLACLVHIRMGGPQEVGSRTMTAVSLVVPLIVIFSSAVSQYVRTMDEGRDMLQQAVMLDDSCWHIRMLHSNPINSPSPGNVLIPVASPNVLCRHQSYRYDRTIRACDQLLRTCPQSAYRSAALYLEFCCLSLDWKPQEAMETEARLDREYPRNGYRLVNDLHTSMRLQNLMLMGDYRQVVRTLHDLALEDPKPAFSRTGYHAAVVEGAWDEAIRICRDNVRYLESQPDCKTRAKRQEIEEWKSKIHIAEAKKARREPPTPRTDVEERLILSGAPAAGVRVCLVPAGELSPMREIRTVGAANLGGIVGKTDASGTCHISRVPSGEYEVLVILPPDSHPDKFTAPGAALPFKVHGHKIRLPDLRLQPENTEAQRSTEGKEERENGREGERGKGRVTSDQSPVTSFRARPIGLISPMSPIRIPKTGIRNRQ